MEMAYQAQKRSDKNAGNFSFHPTWWIYTTYSTLHTLGICAWAKYKWCASQTDSAHITLVRCYHARNFNLINWIWIFHRSCCMCSTAYSWAIRFLACFTSASFLLFRAHDEKVFFVGKIASVLCHIFVPFKHFFIFILLFLRQNVRFLFVSCCLCSANHWNAVLLHLEYMTFSLLTMLHLHSYARANEPNVIVRVILNSAIIHRKYMSYRYILSSHFFWVKINLESISVRQAMIIENCSLEHLSALSLLLDGNME